MVSTASLVLRKLSIRKEGNVGDINLSLIAALRYAGFSVEPMILSTRSNGLPTELFPVLTDFNYVVAKLNLNDKIFLLDATDNFVPFGLLPERCLNGKGRVLGEKQSYWHEIKPADRAKQLNVLNLKLAANGILKGTIHTTYIGYKAAEKRRKIYALSGVDAYVKDLDKRWTKIEIQSFSYENLENFSKPLVEKFDVEIEAYDSQLQHSFLFNPFIIEGWKNNPFKSNERLFPVDFGAPLDETVILNLEFPEGFEVVDMPSKVALALPNNGGRFLFDVQNNGNRLMLSNSLLISKTVFTSEEYHYLRELFNQVVASHAAEIVFRKRATN